MYILKHSMAGALALLFLTGTQAHDDTVAGLSLAQGSLASKDRSAPAVQNRASCGFTDADNENCRLEAEAAYPKFTEIEKQFGKTGKIPKGKTEKEMLCKGWFVHWTCNDRLLCKKCPGDKTNRDVEITGRDLKRRFTKLFCKEFKPPGDYQMSCPKEMSSPGNSGGISTGSSAENSANKSLQIIAGVVGVLVVFGLIGVLMFFFVFKKKKDDGNKSASGASQPAGKKTQGKTGQSTMDSSKPKSTTGGAKSMTKAKTTKPKTSAGGAKSSKSTTA